VPTDTFSTPGAFTWTAPARVTSAAVTCRGGGAAGVSAGATVPVTPRLEYPLVVGAGAAAGDSSFGDPVAVLGAGGGGPGADGLVTVAYVQPALVAPGLTVADNGDGTGVTLTVTGLTPAAGASARVWYRVAGGDVWVKGQAFAVTGAAMTRVVPPVPFPFWGAWMVTEFDGADEARSDQAVTSTVAYGLATDGESVQERILLAVEGRTKELRLPGRPAVVRRKNLSDANLPLNSVVVTAHNQSETPAAGTNGSNYQDQPATVLVHAGEAHDNSTEARLHLWRETITDAFNGQRLTGVPEVMFGKAQLAQVVLTDPQNSVKVYSAVSLKFRTRRMRPAVA
jgi:hypothetical protein